MGLFLVSPQDVAKKQVNGETVTLIKHEKIAQLTPQILGLGDVTRFSEQLDVVSAIFDLAGFTRFSNQPGSSLDVPKFLSRFLNWLFDELRKQHTSDIYDEGVRLYSSLPFFLKFMGDGVLLLWRTTDVPEWACHNIIITCVQISNNYENQLYPQLLNEFSNPPHRLRCGIARGHVLSIGELPDFVGQCINICSRLQGLSTLSCCIFKRGFDMAQHMSHAASQFLIKAVNIRGVGDNELVYVHEHEFSKHLSGEERKKFRDPETVGKSPYSS